MPKRTNEYQKLVLAINQLLASSNVKITESAMLYDPVSDQDREIDILIEDTSGPYSFKVGIECTAKSRSIGVPVMEQLINKHKNVGIHKTVIVSKSGFAVSAQKFAKKNQIDAISFGQALSQSWPSFLNKVKNVQLILHSTTIDDIGFNVTFLESADKVEYSLESTVLADTNDNVLISNFVYDLISSGSTKNIKESRLIDGEKTENGSKHHQEWSFENEIIIADKHGVKAKCSKLSANYTIVRLASPQQLNYEEFNKKPAIYGTSNNLGENKDTSITVTATGNDDGVSMAFNINSRSGLNFR
ncbi:restriction endonuclease [Flocculibacter collagenilyticus]|uniref:restriction endonuclease n=1 Tax=Flocculibacter collagenilyticus TaxID=2744479 RepID=UPI0018F3C62B|nr:restriction endonuclease [Flocculibacter collagenilyticus]